MKHDGWSGFVYILLAYRTGIVGALASSAPDYAKIGWSSDPRKRIFAIKSGRCVAPPDLAWDTISMWHAFWADNAPRAEAALHLRAEESFERVKSEWFSLTADALWSLRRVSCYVDGQFMLMPEAHFDTRWSPYGGGHFTVCDGRHSCAEIQNRAISS